MIARATLCAALSVAPLACTRPQDTAAVEIGGGGSNGGGAPGGGGGTSAGGSGGGGSGAGGSAGGGSSGSTAPTSTCGKGTTFFLVGQGNEIFAFDPATDAVKDLGPVSCPESEGAQIVSAALGADGTAYYLLDNQIVLLGKSGIPTACGFWSKPPAADAEAIAFNGGATERLVVATDGKVFATDAPSTSSWDVLGSLPPGYTARALLGTGDGRLFAALSPSDDVNFRVARLDLAAGSATGTVLIPSPDGAPDESSGFALYGDELLLFAGKSLVRYRFSTEELGTPKILPDIVWPIVAVAAPACASTAPP